MANYILQAQKHNQYGSPGTDYLRLEAPFVFIGCIVQEATKNRQGLTCSGHRELQLSLETAELLLCRPEKFLLGHGSMHCVCQSEHHM